jgi:hypothetical protein
MQQYEHVMNFGQASLNVIQALKSHLKAEYSWYSTKEIEQMVYKFLNEYLAKLSLLTAAAANSDSSSLNGEIGNQTTNRSRFTPGSSMSSIFDFNNKEKIEKQIMLQIKLQQQQRSS